MQKDFNENPDNFDLVGQMFLLDGNPYDCQTLSELADEIRWKYIEKNYLLWNDIQVVEGKEKEVDKFGLDDLKNSERGVVENIIAHIKSGKIKAQNLSDLLESWGLWFDGVGWTYGAHMTERSEGRWARPSPTSISIHQGFCEPINQPIRLIFAIRESRIVQFFIKLTGHFCNK